jgi:hypothetical protein
VSSSRGCTGATILGPRSGSTISRRRRSAAGAPQADAAASGRSKSTGIAGRAARRCGPV